MKNIIFCFVLSTSVATMLATTTEQVVAPIDQAVTTMISPTQVFMDIINSHLARAYQEMDANQPLTRKHKNTVTVLLNGLAQSCVFLGNIFSANNTQEKQQGMLNVAGTVLAVAAQLAERHEKIATHQATLATEQQATSTPALEQQAVLAEEQQLAPATKMHIDTSQEDVELVLRLAALTICLITEAENHQLKDPVQLPPMLSLIRSMPTQAERHELIKIMLSSSSHAIQYLTELFTTLHHYVQAKGSQFAELIRDQIAYYLYNKPAATSAPENQAADTDATTTDAPVTPPADGVIAFAGDTKQVTPEILDYLTDQFVMMLHQQLKLIAGADINAEVTPSNMVEGLFASVVSVFYPQ